MPGFLVGRVSQLQLRPMDDNLGTGVFRPWGPSAGGAECRRARSKIHPLSGRLVEFPVELLNRCPCPCAVVKVSPSLALETFWAAPASDLAER